MKQSKKIISVFTHEYPQWVFKYPNTIRIAYFLNYLIQLRKWYVVREVKKMIRSEKDSFSLLDVGCGEGQYIFPLANKYRNAHFTGIDKHPANITFCEKLAVVNNFQNVHFKIESADEVSVIASYNIIFLIGVLQYIPNDELVIAQLYKALKYNGKLLVYVPVNNHLVTSLYKVLLRKYENYETVQNRQRIYTAQQLITLFEKKGFVIQQEIITFGFYGKLSNELLNSFLILINRGNIIFSLLLSILFILIYPFFFLFMMIDFLSVNTEGNGRIFLLKKN